MRKNKKNVIWAYLLHISFNFWSDRKSVPEYISQPLGKHLCYAPHMRFDDTLWEDMLNSLAQAGFNMLLLDLGDAVKYVSHPEIAVEGAWSVDQLRNRINMIRKKGIEPIPALNFSTAHDVWLGKYSKMISTDIYYKVCGDLISEVVEIFDNPRFFHIGMDEETFRHQQ